MSYASAGRLIIQTILNAIFENTYSVCVARLYVDMGESESAIDAEELIKESQKLFFEGNYDASLQLIDVVIENNNQNITAWFCKGVVLVEINEILKAIDSFDRVNLLSPNHPPTMANLAILLEKINPEKSLEYAQIATITYPEMEILLDITNNSLSPIEPKNVGPLLMAIPVSESEELIDNEYKVLTDYDSDENKIQNNVTGELNNFDDDLLELLESNNTGKTEEDIAKELTKSGNYLESVKLWKKILEHKPQSAEVWLGLAESLNLAGYEKKSSQCSQRAESLKRESVINDKVNITNDAVETSVMQQSIAKNTLSPELNKIDNERVNISIEWYNKGTTFLSEDKSEDALTCFEKAIGGCPRDELELRVRCQNGRGDALYNMNKYSESILAYHAAISLAPNLLSGRTLYNMGQSYAYLELYEDGLKCFEQAISRGLENDGVELCKTQINRCKILLREQKKRMPQS